MPRTLEPSDPLNTSALVSVIVLEDDDLTVRDIKRNVTLTKHASTRLPGTTPPSNGAPYGRAFEPGGPATDGNSSWNVSLPAAGAISVPTNAAMSVFYWHNGFVDANTGGYAAYARMMGGAETAGRHCGPAFQFDPATGKVAPCSINGALSLTGLSAIQSAGDARGAGSMAFTRNASNPLKLWIHGARDANYAGSGMAINTAQHGGPQANSEFFCLGGMPAAQTWSRWSYCGVAIWVGYELTDADVSRLHSSLGLNTMALLAAPPVVLGGNVDLNLIEPGGGLTSVASSLGGNIDLDPILPGGGLGMQPGTVTIPALRNGNTGLYAGATIARVVFLNLDATTALALTNQVTHAVTGALTVTNAALLSGQTYIVAGWNADGSLRFIRRVVAA